MTCNQKRQHTTKQHYTPKYRFRFFNDSNNKHHEFYKSGKYSGYLNIGNGIGACNNLYEPKGELYHENELEHYFANHVENQQRQLLQTIIKVVEMRNVLNLESVSFPNTFLLPYSILNYRELVDFINTSVYRLFYWQDLIINLTHNRLAFYIDLCDGHYDSMFSTISICYTSGLKKLILSDVGMAVIESPLAYSTYFPITPTICIQHIKAKGPNPLLKDGKDGKVYIKKIDDATVDMINQSLKEQCYQKFITQSKEDYTRYLEVTNETRT